MKTERIVLIANTIAHEYAREHGLNLTLRQMYYQFVARGLIENGDRSYKRIGVALTNARMKGTFSFHHIEDRGRDIGQHDADDTRTLNEDIEYAGELLAQIPLHTRFGRWYGQGTLVSVWIEKEALSGVLEALCTQLGVSLFACKGYPSVSALDKWLRTTHETLDRRNHQTATILYLGDHDPDGLQIPVSIEKTLHEMQQLQRDRTVFPEDYPYLPRLRFGAAADFVFTIKPIALSIEQIREYDPPPMPAKKTSTRYRKYKERTGLDEAWELDALDPRLLQDLVRSEVSACFDEGVHQDNLVEAERQRAQIVDHILSSPAWTERKLRTHV